MKPDHIDDHAASARTTVAIFTVTALVVCGYVRLAEQGVLREFERVTSGNAAVVSYVHGLEQRVVTLEKKLASQAEASAVRSGPR